MAEHVTILLIGLFLLLALAAIGHILWLLGAAVLELVVGGNRKSKQPRPACPECGSTTQFRDGVCGECHFQVAPGCREALLESQAQLDRLFQLNRISAEQYSAVHWALQSELLAASSGMRDSPLPANSVGQHGPTQVDGTVMGETEAGTDAIPIIEAEVIGQFPVQSTVTSPVLATDAQATLHPLDRDEPMDDTDRSESFRPALADMLQAFLEEKNIRWGELASGILIVGCAIGLIISLRATLAQLSAQVPYIPALLFMLGTAAIHVAGLYTLRRWKLRSTSRGVLVIATLLVPLSFAAGIILSGSGPSRVAVASPLYVVAVLIGVIGYGVITAYSARALFPTTWWPLVVAVMVPSVGQLPINRLATARPAWPGMILMAGLFGLPLAGFMIATLAQLGVVIRKKRLTPMRAMQTYTVLGIAAFSLIVPLVLLLWLRSDWRTVIAELAPMLTVTTAVIIGTGLAIRNRSAARAMAATSTVGTALAIFGTMLMVGTVLAAWPRPEILIVVSGTAAIVLAVLAMAGTLSPLLAGALGLAAFSFLVTWHWASGIFDLQTLITGRQLLAVLTMGRSAAILMVPAAAGGLLAWTLSACRRNREAVALALGAGGIEVVAAGIALYAGFYSTVDVNWVTPLFAVYAATALICAPPIGRPVSGWVGSLFGLVFLIHLCVWNPWAVERLTHWPVVVHHPYLLAFLVHALAAQLAAGGIAIWLHLGSSAAASKRRQARCLVEPLVVSGIVTSVLAVPTVLMVQHTEVLYFACFAAALAATWVTASFIKQVPALMMAGQTAATYAIVLAVVAYAQDRFWPESPLHKIWHWQLQLSVLALWCTVLAALRMAVGRHARISLSVSDSRKVIRPPDKSVAISDPDSETRACARRLVTMQRLLFPAWLTIDQVLLAVLVPGLVVISALGCWPGLLVELGVWSVNTGQSVSQWTAVAHEPGGWIALACVALALTVSIGERLRGVKLVGLCLVTATIPLLIAGRFEPHCAVASAVRWLFATYTLVWAVLLAARRQIEPLWSALWPFQRRAAPRRTPYLQFTTLLLGIGPVVVVTGWACLRLQSGQPLGGPQAASWFGQFALNILYAVPLGLLVVSLLITAVRDRLPASALVGSLILQWLVGLGVAIPLAMAGRTWAVADSVHLVQWSACALVVYGLVWVALGRWIERTEAGIHSVCLQAQLAFATAAAMFIATWAAWEVIRDPIALSLTATTLSQWPSFVAIVGWILFAGCYFVARERHETIHVVAVGGWAIVTLGAVAPQLLPVSVMWPHYHQLLGSWLLYAVVMTAAAWWPQRHNTATQIQDSLRRWATAVSGVALCLVTSNYLADPLNPWWTAGACISLLGLFILLGLRARHRWYGYATIPISVMVVTILYHDFGPPLFQRADWGFVGILAATSVSVVWLAIELWYQFRDAQSFDDHSRMPRVHLAWAVFGTLLMAVIVGGGFALMTAGSWRGARTNLLATPWAVAALGSVAFLLCAAYWDTRSRFTTAGLYSCGLVAIAMALHMCQSHTWIGQRQTLVLLTISSAVFVSLTGHVWKWGANLVRWAETLHMPHPLDELQRTGRWLPTANVLGVGSIIAMSLVLVVTSDQRSIRMTAAIAPLLAAYGIACLAQQQRQLSMQCLSLLMVSVAAVFIGWASNRPTDARLTILHYTIQLTIVMAAASVIYGAVIVRWLRATSSWYEASRTTSVITALLTGLAMCAALIMEIVHFRPGVGVPIATVLVVAVSVMLGLLAVALLSMALLPGRDPLGLSDKRREIYVYAAQVVAGLLFAHVYLTKPYLFNSFLRPYWPYLVMLLAFASVALGEICQRFDWRVLADPLQRTGGLLPLIPALGIWIVTAQGNHALVLFFVGLLYVVLAVVRRSYAAGLAAAVAANGAIWSLLHDSGFSLLAQPQFWLIPPALSVLLASQLNRNRLTEAQLTAVRYICVIIIYLSSSGEMFMKMLIPTEADHWSRPVILASLAVAGIFAGILLRIRAFLYLGTSFLLLSVVAMVWNAARLVQHTWPWWAFGITLGLFILVMFGVFEKHRREAQQLVQRLRQWEP